MLRETVMREADFAFSLCVFCIRRRGRDTPVRRRGRASTKKPALERSEARERLQSVVEVSNVTGNEKAACVDRIEEKTVSDSESTFEKEWYVDICHVIAFN